MQDVGGFRHFHHKGRTSPSQIIGGANAGKDSVVFLHAVKEGAASQSYGLQVAALAGVPLSVIARARERLRQLEDIAAHRNPNMESGDQIPLFNASMPSPVMDFVDALKPDDLSPKQALETLYKLKQLQQAESSETKK